MWTGMVSQSWACELGCCFSVDHSSGFRVSDLACKLGCWNHRRLQCNFKGSQLKTLIINCTPTHMRMHANTCTHTCAIPAHTQENTHPRTHTHTHFSILVEVGNKTVLCWPKLSGFGIGPQSWKMVCNCKAQWSFSSVCLEDVIVKESRSYSFSYELWTAAQAEWVFRSSCTA